MKSWFILIVAIISCTAFACAQEGPSSEQLFSSDLIAWSGMQQPQPPQQPGQQTAPTASAQTPSTQNSSASANQQQPQDSDASSAASQNQAPTASSFTGTIAKEADLYVLKISETRSYKLDAQHQIEQYEGQRVRVTGTLESAVNIIHVDRIEPLS
jgi:hypothetical protein